MAPAPSLARIPDGKASVEADLERAAALWAERFILKRRGLAEDAVDRIRLRLQGVAESAPELWLPLLNLHWVATHQKKDKEAAWALEEAVRRKTSSPFAAAYFARALSARGEHARAVALLDGATPAADSHGKTEFTLARMTALAHLNDNEGLIGAYADRLRQSDGHRDTQHFILHMAYAAEQLPAAVRARMEGPAMVAGLRKLMKAEPKQVGHVLALVTLLSTMGRRGETIEALVADAEQWCDHPAFRDYFVATSWRLLESADPTKPN